jgi:PUA-domain protein
MSFNVHQRHLLKAKDIKQLVDILKQQFGESVVNQMLTPKSKVEYIKIKKTTEELKEEEELYAIEGVVALWAQEGKYLPLLSYLLKSTIPFKHVKVDVGAIKFVSNGADVMRPGITFIDPTIQIDDIVLIQDSVHGRTLAVGKALFNATEIQTMDKGKVIKTVHSLKDAVWEFSKTFQ